MWCWRWKYRLCAMKYFIWSLLIFGFLIMPYYRHMGLILTSCSSVSVHENAKKEQGQYQAILTGQAWSIKGLLYGQKITPKNFTFAGIKWETPSSQDRPILPAWIANQNTGFASSCLLLEPAIWWNCLKIQGCFTFFGVLLAIIIL